jgi:RecA-family ATPase
MPTDKPDRLNSFTGLQSLGAPLAEIPELINNWIRMGDLTLLIGASGVGKSTVSLPLGLSLAGGVPFLGSKVSSAEPVLYLDLEMGEYEFRTRLNTLLPQFPKIAAKNFHWISLPNKDITSFKIDVERDSVIGLSPHHKEDCQRRACR